MIWLWENENQIRSMKKSQISQKLSNQWSLTLSLKTLLSRKYNFFVPKQPLHIAKQWAVHMESHLSLPKQPNNLPFTKSKSTSPKPTKATTESKKPSRSLKAPSKPFWRSSRQRNSTLLTRISQWSMSPTTLVLSQLLKQGRCSELQSRICTRNTNGRLPAVCPKPSS